MKNKVKACGITIKGDAEKSPTGGDIVLIPDHVVRAEKKKQLLNAAEDKVLKCLVALRRAELRLTEKDYRRLLCDDG